MILNRRNSSIRGDREMTFIMMKDKISYYEDKIVKAQDRIRNRLFSESEKLKIDSGLDSLSELSLSMAKEILRMKIYQP